MKSVRLAVDTGGTFTDSVIMDEELGEFIIEKIPSTPSDPSQSFLQIVCQSLETVGVRPDGVTYLVHGTTVATNSIIEGKTAKSGFLTTKGFRDILEIGRQIKPELFNLFFEKPRPLIPRHLCLEIPERMDYQGSVIQSLSVDEVQAAASVFRKEGVESIAICFLHSYCNPTHEEAARDILKRELPGIQISLSSDICPEYREYFRASTTAVNTVIVPILARYLERIQSRLRELGFQTNLCVMQSNGGICTAEIASKKPVHIVESGPAAGAIVAAHIGSLTRQPNVISLDIGGTTAKVGLIQDGTPKISNAFEVGSKSIGHQPNSKAAGYPIKSSVVDLVEIGSGGGSIGWVDNGGALRVGPRSAGADPGPACYGRGGVLPTLTDANLILGRINAESFLGGKIKLSVGAAAQAMEHEIASRLHLTVTEAAFGMLEIANSSMIEALRMISVQRGFDPREFALVAFGGAGPLQANAIAAEVGIRELIIPMSPGVSSALGLLLADLKHDFVRTYIRPLTQVDVAFINDTLRSFKERGREALLVEGVPDDKQSFVCQIDMRYAGQSFELKVPVVASRVDEEVLRSLEEAFHRLHERTYGHFTLGEPVEVVNLRLTAKGIIPKPKIKRLAHTGNEGGHSLKGHRDVCFNPAEGYRSTPTYDRYQLPAGSIIAGPAVIEEFDSTTVLQPGYSASVDEFGSLHIVPAIAQAAS